MAHVPPGTEEAESLYDTHTTAGGDLRNGDDVVTAQLARVDPVLDTGFTGAGNATANGPIHAAPCGDTWTAGEWGALSGHLIEVTDGTRALSAQPLSATDTGFPDGTTVFQVPVDVVGTAIDSGPATPAAADTDSHAHVPADAFAGGEKFGPSDHVDQLLHADQVPGLLTVASGPIGLLDVQHTQVIPAFRDAMPETQIFPAITDDMPAPLTAARQPVHRVMPAPRGAAPRPGPHYRSAPSIQLGQTVPMRALPDLPPVRTLPSMPRHAQDSPMAPPMPASTRSAPGLFTPVVPVPPAPRGSGPSAGSRPITQDRPSGSARHLMAHLRGLADDLDTGGGRHGRSMFGDDL